MSIFLLDVNVLLALFDSTHVHFDAAHHWFVSSGEKGWATCPTTENGFLRIASNPGYPQGRPDTGDVMTRLADFCAREEHHFWAESVSLRDLLRPGVAVTHRQITDVYLLGLAAHHGGKLATFDRRIPASAVYGGPDALAIIPV